MAANFSKADGVTPLITFASIIILGIIISEFVVKEEKYQLTIILFSFFVAFFVAAMELRTIVARRRIRSTSGGKMNEHQRKQKLARYVADLFEEDIPFEEVPEVEETENDEINLDHE